MVFVSCTPKPLDVLNGFQQFWRRKGMSLDKSVQPRRKIASERRTKVKIRSERASKASEACVRSDCESVKEI